MSFSLEITGSLVRQRLGENLAGGRMICSNCNKEYIKSLDKYIYQDCLDQLWITNEQIAKSLEMVRDADKCLIWVDVTSTY